MATHNERNDSVIGIAHAPARDGWVAPVTDSTGNGWDGEGGSQADDVPATQPPSDPAIDATAAVQRPGAGHLAAFERPAGSRGHIVVPFAPPQRGGAAAFRRPSAPGPSPGPVGPPEAPAPTAGFAPPPMAPPPPPRPLPPSGLVAPPPAPVPSPADAPFFGTPDPKARGAGNGAITAGAPPPPYPPPASDQLAPPEDQSPTPPPPPRRPSVAAPALATAGTASLVDHGVRDDELIDLTGPPAWPPPTGEPLDPPTPADVSPLTAGQDRRPIVGGGGFLAGVRHRARRRQSRSQRASASLPPAALDAHEISAWFGDHCVLDRVSLNMAAGRVTALIGPSGCGKSTFLRILNRMHELIPGAALAGEVLLNGSDIYDPGRKLTDARRQIGMVFQKPNPFPAMSVYDNVLAGLKLTGAKADQDTRDELVEECLTRGGLWKEVRDRLRQPGGALSGGQQQRLCIARALAVRPRVLLMDEPCSALDPTSTRRIEETIGELSSDVTIVIVTHNMQQAARVSQECAFFLAEQGQPGYIVEHGPTDAMFSAPLDPRTADYVGGRFG